MKRRSFIKSMLAAAVAPMWLPSAGRVWVPTKFSFNPESLTDLIIASSGRFAPSIYSRIPNPWVDLVLKRGTYPSGLGETMLVVTY